MRRSVIAIIASALLLVAAAFFFLRMRDEAGYEPLLPSVSPMADDATAPATTPHREQPARVAPPSQVTADDEDSEDSEDPYAHCEELEGDSFSDCTDAVDERVSALEDACDRFEDDADTEKWGECMDAAERAEPYPG